MVITLIFGLSVSSYVTLISNYAVIILQ